MNGAEGLVRSLVGCGVEAFFANPGTSEMHLVAALDRVDGTRPVLCLFEGVATGAADGYARMAGKPGATLLHLGPGLGNGIANLHNAQKAFSPIINIVGEHATWHRSFNAPLTSDIEGLASPVSRWVKTAQAPAEAGVLGVDAFVESQGPAGGVATLILPADTAWTDGGTVAAPRKPAAFKRVDDAAIDATVEALGLGNSTLLLVGGAGLMAENLTIAAAIAEKTGAKLMAPGANPRLQRGGSRPAIERVPYVVDRALAILKSYTRVVLLGARVPVAFFGYPGKPSRMTSPDAVIVDAADAEHDISDALQRVAARLGVATSSKRKPPPRPVLANGPLTPDSIGQVLGALLPEAAIVCDESITTGRSFFAATESAPEHDWLQLTGGAIGLGMPLAVGAAVACPSRKIINLEADGSAMYTVQALWTQAREKLNVLTCIWANRSYNILKGELANVGAANPGRKALDMLSLDAPAIDWVRLAGSLGVDARRVETVFEFAEAFSAGLKKSDPYLIEVVIDT